MLLTGGSIFDPGWDSLIRWGGNFGPYTTGGEYWRLASAAFVHGGIIHILFNMWCLYSLGPLSERLFGKWQTICIYLLTGVGGSLLSIAYDPMRLSVGASGAIFGIAGALLAGLKFGNLSISAGQKRAIITSMITFAVLNFSLGAARNSVDNMAHLGGFVTGLLVGLPLGAFARNHKLYQLGTVLATALVLFAGGRELVRDHGAKGLLYRAEAATKHRDFPKAIQLLEKHRLLRPDDVNALTWLGDLYSATDQRDKAAEAYEHALKLNPNSDDAKQGLDDLREAGLTGKR